MSTAAPLASLRDDLAFHLAEGIDPGPETLRRWQASAADTLRELEAAHRIIRHALAVMTTEQKNQWGRLNATAGVDGEGVTRANERAAVIARAGGKA